MTLFASAYTHGNVKSGPIGDIGISKCCGMFTAGTMAVFALDAREVLQRRGHGSVIGGAEHRREFPAVGGGDIVKSAVVGQGIRVEADVWHWMQLAP